MATITDRLGHFTGHVGPVRFTKGVATTHDADMVAYFRADPDRYDVETDELAHDEQPDPTDQELIDLEAELAALEAGEPATDPDED